MLVNYPERVKCTTKETGIPRRKRRKDGCRDTLTITINLVLSLVKKDQGEGGVRSDSRRKDHCTRMEMISLKVLS